MKHLRTLKKWVSDFNAAKQLTDDLEVLYDFYKMGDVSENELKETHQQLLDVLEDIEFRNMLSDVKGGRMEPWTTTASKSVTRALRQSSFSNASVAASTRRRSKISR